jgi:multicomponent Na+:H+ antiporter subunit D
LVLGVQGAFVTADIFNLYVWFEVLLIASFILLSLGGERAQLEGAIKYVALNLLSSALFLAGVGILYGMAGTLNMADLARYVQDHPDQKLLTAVSFLFLTAFGIKAAMFPLFFWLPASYHTPPPAVSAVFAGLLTKVGVYALIRIFTLVFTAQTALTHGIILGGAAFTMITGVLGAASQIHMRRILSFHIVSQIGYMVMGLGLFTPLALAGSIFYLIHHIIVKTNLFLVAGYVRRVCGTEELARLGGLYRSRPLAAALFLVPALSLAGLPPLSGFFAKLLLVLAAIRHSAWIVAGVALGVGLLTLYSMMKIWAAVFWGAPGPDSPAPERADPDAGRHLLLPVLGLALLTVAIGFGAGPVYTLSRQAAESLLEPSRYIAAVLEAP